MTTQEAPPEVATFSIVVCGTCDNVFRLHAGRPSCPLCGGEPRIVLYEGEIPIPSDDQAPSTEGEAPAPAEGGAPPEKESKRGRSKPATRDKGI